MERYTEEQIKAAKDALVIVDPGACNLTGVALALHAAGKAWLHSHGTDAANTSAPVRLIMTQLIQLAFGSLVDVPLDVFSTAFDECKMIVSAGEERGSERREGACIAS
jgi:hypothetical protein